MTASKLSLLRQLTWAATLATGFGTLWFALLLWLGTSIQEAWQGGRANWPPQEILQIRSDGTPLIESIPHQNMSQVTYRDLSGRVQEVPDRNNLLSVVSMSGAHGTPSFFSSSPGWEERLKLFMDEREPNVIWFFVHDGKQAGAGYFVGYERVSNRRVGFIGLSGFRSDPVPTAEWIPVRGEHISDYSQWSSLPLWLNSGPRWLAPPERWDLPPRLVYVPSGNHLRLVDLAARTVTTVFETSEPIESPGIPKLSNWTSGRVAKEQPILVRTRQQIHALDHKHNIIKVFTIPTEADRQSPADWYDLGNGQSTVVFSLQSSTGEDENLKRHILYRLADDGAIKDQSELTLQSGSPRANKRAQACLLAIGLPEPAILFVADLLLEIDFDRIRNGPAILLPLLRNSGTSLIVVLALSSILAVTAWRRGRAFGLSKLERIVWAVFVLLLGLAAFVGFLLYRRWPLRQPCPNCHAPSPRDRATCSECGTRFPDPCLKGIEIFA
jgi:hypothetical protein